MRYACPILALAGVAWVGAALALAAPARAQDPPTNVTATSTAPTEVAVAWSPPAGALQLIVQRGPGSGGPWAAASAALPASADDFTDTTVEPGTTYGYRVVASYGGGEKAASNPVTVTTQSEAPPPDRRSGRSAAGGVAAHLPGGFAGAAAPVLPANAASILTNPAAAVAVLFSDLVIEPWQSNDGFQEGFAVRNLGKGNAPQVMFRVRSEILPPPPGYDAAEKAITEGLMDACSKPIQDLDWTVPPLPAGELHTFVLGPNESTMMVGTTQLALPSGGGFSYSHLNSVSGVCAWKITLTVDPTGQAVESNEGNNQHIYGVGKSISLQ